MIGGAVLAKHLKGFALLAVLGAGLACLLFTLNSLAENSTYYSDFPDFYSAGTIVRGPSAHRLYDLGLEKELDAEIAPRAPFTPFLHPALEALLVAPLTLLPYRSAFIVWSLLSLSALGFAVYLFRYTGYTQSTSDLLVWVAVTVPLCASVLVHGQDELFLTLIFLLAFLALKRRRELAGGLVLGLGVFRFEVILPFVFILFLRRRWRVLAGFSGVAALGLVLSAAVVGWPGLVGYLRLLVSAGRGGEAFYGYELTWMPTIRGIAGALLGGAVTGQTLFLLVLAGTLLLLFWAAREFSSLSAPESRGFDLQFCMGVVASLLAGYHMWDHGLAPLILVAFLVLGYQNRARRDGLLRDGAATTLLVLFASVRVAGAVLGFVSFSVLTVVLLGLMLWLAQEIAALRGLGVSG